MKTPKSHAATRTPLTISALSLLLTLAGCHGASSQTTSTNVNAATPLTTNVARPALSAADFDPKPDTPPAMKFSGARAYRTLKDFVALGPRPLASAGHAQAEQFILARLNDAAGTTRNAPQIEQDKFETQTAAGRFAMNNIIAKFPGTRDGIIVLAGHYDTNYPLRHTSFVGANDGGSNVGLMLEIASQLRQRAPQGYSLWLVFTDGEEATVNWTDADSVYGAKHLATKWAADGTAAKIKAFLLLDMIGDKQLDLDNDTNSTPWLRELVRRAATRAGEDKSYSNRLTEIQDDHLPFRAVGIPVVDLIDLDYGFNNLYHHTTEDTPDKCSAASLTAVGRIVAETLRALNTR